jgi:isoquinoline 1-oxidoreductase subunit beta
MNSRKTQSDQIPAQCGSKLAAKKIGWGRTLPAGSGLGIAAHRSFLSYVAMAVEVTVSKKGKLTISRVEAVIDCGLAVNPDRVRSQIEGGAIFGASLALFGEISATKGQVTQSNFHDYRVARMNEAPREINVHIVPSEAPPSGVGEPGVPPFAPALCNAIQAATGKRIRSLPLSKHDLSWS